MNSEQMKQLGIKEIYLPIDGFPNYEVSNYGNVRNKSTGRILKAIKSNTGYYNVSLCNGVNKPIPKQIHRLVLTTFENNNYNKSFVDHIDNNRINSCLFNLRYATNRENHFNRSISSRNTSGVKGVSWFKRDKKWRVRIGVNEKQIHIGYYDNIEDAIQARKAKAKELFGEFINKCEG